MASTDTDMPEADAQISSILTSLSNPPALTLLTLSKPLLQPASPTHKRASNISTTSNGDSDSLTPASLTADLEHYKELFSKLRFSYLEQVTKEKFLRSITADPPLLVEAGENVALEGELGAAKASLKAQKEEVAARVLEVEERARGLARRYEIFQLQTTQLQTLPSAITSLSSTRSALISARPTPSTPATPSLSLPLPATLDLLAQRRAQIVDLDAQLAHLQRTLPPKTQQLERAEEELKVLAMRKREEVQKAKEAQRGREGGQGEELERRGRWERGVEGALQAMSEV
ncbi:hypothetical protein B0A49_07589 [Cryomyces minteri]|uniref:Kinetochore protein Sos7 coiled-coil domain-containing protein n=1 Tax=Cryomyces minteri TaxID=331657 RepID=A0A4V6WKU8_9PEZI|nr:hypothetical protein B0A49_07589 [Cryomyces minteri]